MGNPPQAESQQPIVRIRPVSGWISFGFADLWVYRELLFFFAWRDIKVRYKQTVLGASWALLQPALSMLVFSVIFGRLVGVPSDGAPYPAFVLAGLLPWQLFSAAFTHASASLVAHENMIRKVYFPRLLLPMSSVVASLVDFGVSLVLLFALMALYEVPPRLTWLTLPVFTAIGAATAFGASLWLSALTARFRDFRHTLPFLTQAWLFVTPVLYPSSLIPERWQAAYGLNPLVGVVDGFRWALLGTPAPPWAVLAPSLTGLVAMLLTGWVYFRRTERTIADVI